MPPVPVTINRDSIPRFGSEATGKSEKIGGSWVVSDEPGTGALLVCACQLDRRFGEPGSPVDPASRTGRLAVMRGRFPAFGRYCMPAFAILGGADLRGGSLVVGGRDQQPVS